MHILSSSFEAAFAAVETPRHLERSLSGGMGENSISNVREEFLRAIEVEPDVQERMLKLGGFTIGLPAIYGDGGWNRYVVLVTGEVMFHELAGKTRRQEYFARQMGFRVFSRDLYGVENGRSSQR